MTNAGRLQGGDAQPTESAESDWSDPIANAGDTPIGELVDGLHEVAALPIAYPRCRDAPTPLTQRTSRAGATSLVRP